MNPKEDCPKRSGGQTQSVSNDYSLYLIKCEHEVYYVGISSHVESRILSHYKGTGSEVTKKFPPITHCILKSNLTEEEAKYFEKSTVSKMKKFTGRVYGAGWCVMKKQYTT